MKYLIQIWNKISPPEPPKYGWRIFQQQKWLDKQVQEAIRKRGFGLD